MSASAQQWRPEAKAAKAGETSRTVAVRPSGSTLRYTGQNAFSLVIIALCPMSNNTVKLYSEKGATSSKSLYGDCTKPSCKEGPLRHERRNSAYCDRGGGEFQETHQLQTLRVCSSRVYKKIQILDSSTSFVKEVYTKMYSIYTAARTTPSSQMLLYSSLCTKRKKQKQGLQWRCTAAREPVGRSNVYKSVCKKRGSAAKGDAGLPRREGRPGKRRENLERSHKLREVG